MVAKRGCSLTEHLYAMRTESPPSSTIRSSCRKSIAIFVGVCLVHGLLGWWMLSARFDLSHTPADSPIMVILVEDRAEVSDAAPEGAATLAPSVSLAAENPSGSDTTVTAPQRAQAIVDKLVDIALDDPVDTLAEPLAGAPIQAPSSAVVPAAPRPRQPPPVHPGPAKPPVDPQQAAARAEPRASERATPPGVPQGWTQAGAEGTGQVSAGPRRVTHLDYLGGPPNAVYPPRAKGRRQQGQVVVRVLISSAGQITSADVLKTSGVDSLDQAALDAVRRTKFRPYAENGHAYDALADIPFDFVLKN